MPSLFDEALAASLDAVYEHHGVPARYLHKDGASYGVTLQVVPEEDRSAGFTGGGVTREALFVRVAELQSEPQEGDLVELLDDDGAVTETVEVRAPRLDENRCEWRLVSRQA